MDAPAEGGGGVFGHARFSFESGEAAGDILNHLLQFFFFLFRENDYEFIAAESAAVGFLSCCFSKDVRHAAKEGVPFFVALEVVHFFQAVQVQEEKAVGLFGVQFLRCAEDAGVVQKAGKGVVEGQMEGGFLFLGFFILGEELAAEGEGDGEDEYEEGPGGKGLHEAEGQEALAVCEIVLQDYQGGGSGGNENVPAYQDVPYFFFFPWMEQLEADEDACGEDEYVQDGQQVVQGKEAGGLGNGGEDEEDKETGGQKAAHIFSGFVCFRQGEITKEGGWQEVEGAVFEEGVNVGVSDPESQHMMVA